MEFSRIKNILIRLISVFALITVLNFLITGHIKSNYVSLNKNSSNDSALNEDFYQIENNKLFSKQGLLNDINNIETALTSEYEASAHDSDMLIEYYKKIYNIYDGRLMSIYNSISNRVKDTKDKNSIYNDLYNFKIKRIDEALLISNAITDNKKRLSEYYKSLSEQTKAKCIEFIDNYVAFLDK